MQIYWKSRTCSFLVEPSLLLRDIFIVSQDWGSWDGAGGDEQRGSVGSSFENPIKGTIRKKQLDNPIIPSTYLSIKPTGYHDISGARLSTHFRCSSTIVPIWRTCSWERSLALLPDWPYVQWLSHCAMCLTKIIICHTQASLSHKHCATFIVPWHTLRYYKEISSYRYSISVTCYKICNWTHRFVIASYQLTSDSFWLIEFSRHMKYLRSGFIIVTATTMSFHGQVRIGTQVF